MEYETVEQKLSEVNAHITGLNNEIVKLTWIDKDFNKSRVRDLMKKVETLLDKKYELIECLTQTVIEERQATLNTKYRIVDLNKGLMADDTYIYAKSPLEAVRQYALELMKNPQNIVRDYESKGRFIVYGSGKSFVYKEVER